MPVHRGTDSVGAFYQWGLHGKRYYYRTSNYISRRKAMEKAARQGRAAHAR